MDNYRSFPIWKIDSQRLLQKYEAFEQNGRLLHRAICTVCVLLVSVICSNISRCVGQPWALLYPPPLDNIQVMVIVYRLRGNIIRTALCWIVWHNVHSQQHTYTSSCYRFNRLDLSHWVCNTVRRAGCLELYYCNMVEWFWWDSSLISMTNWFPSVLCLCWFGHLACKNRLRNDL